MNGSYILDTNIVIGLFADDQEIVQHIKGAQEVYVPAIVIGELLFGASRSGRAEENIKRVEELASLVQILNCDLGTAREYGRIKASLRQIGRPIPENDIWIAANGLQHGIPVVTRDSHFKEIIGLPLEIW